MSNLSMIERRRDSRKSGDPILGMISKTAGVCGEFVSRYPGKEAGAQAQDWLDNWFRQRTEWYLDNSLAATPSTAIAKEELVEETQKRQESLGAISPRLLAIHPHFFRGFRDEPQPIRFDGDLVVIEGRNSSGKTSLGEAVEWLLSGALQRRAMQDQGNARELESLITNQFKPEDQETWVAGELGFAEDQHISIKRVLQHDYTNTQKSCCESVLFVDERQLSVDEEVNFLEGLFGGVPPILMQHTLRLFVHSSPADRRRYFESLLRLDELTFLIEKAVVGDSRLSEFSSPGGSVALKRWETLKASVKAKGSKNLLVKAEKIAKTDRTVLRRRIEEELYTAATAEFSEVVFPQGTLESAVRAIAATQRKERQKAFPLLGALRPKRSIDDSLRSTFRSDALHAEISDLEEAGDKFQTCVEAAALIGEAQIAVAQAFDVLNKKGLIFDLASPQICPVCEYSTVQTLTPTRMQEILSWHPVQQARQEMEITFSAAVKQLRGSVQNLQIARAKLVPSLSSDEDWEQATRDVAFLVDAATRFRQTAISAISCLIPFDSGCTQLLTLLGQSEQESGFVTRVKSKSEELARHIDSVIETAARYVVAFGELENAVGSVAQEDPNYKLKDLWLDVANDLDNLVADLYWEQAKVRAQNELTRIRESLIGARTEILNLRREAFSTGMTEVWKALREDRYSAFSQLAIPEPRGKGFPIEIEVKAKLDDGTTQCEVDALKVFSESQVNVLGIAAFVTRSKMLKHRTIILDDPVQSMDEDHFKTFAQALVPNLLDAGFQVVLLTHNDSFARELSLAHIDRDTYVTMSIRHSRKEGCLIEEGNRRVSERLKRAEEKADEGDLKQAWTLVRLALERLYTVAYKKHGPSDFKPDAWLDQTAEYMWTNGAGAVIERFAPDKGLRLKEILGMSAAGAHDKHPSGPTDLLNAVRDIRGLLPKLRIGSG